MYGYSYIGYFVCESASEFGAMGFTSFWGFSYPNLLLVFLNLLFLGTCIIFLSQVLGLSLGIFRYFFRYFSVPYFGLACVCCVFSPFILDIKFVGRTSRGHTEGRSHRRKVKQDFSSTFFLQCVP